MTLQSIAIVSETPLTQKQDLIYIQSFSGPGGDEDEGLFESDLFDFGAGTNAGVVSDQQDDLDPRGTGSLCSLRHQFLIHSALELFDGASMDQKSNGTHSPMFIGFICALDDLRFYGYKTNTGVRIIVSVKDDILPSKPEFQKARDDYIDSAISQIHSTYVEYILNPFNAKQGCIKSRRFQQQMDQIASM